MVEGLLKGLKKDDQLQGPLSSKVLDQGDAVGAWFGKDQGGPLAAILFATSETLKQVSPPAVRSNDAKRLIHIYLHLSRQSQFSTTLNPSGRAD